MSDNITLRREVGEQVRNFLHHLRKWDVLSIPNSDGAFWCREIDAALAALDAALAEPSLQVRVDPTAFTAAAFSQAAVLEQAKAFETAYQTKRATLNAALKRKDKP